MHHHDATYPKQPKVLSYEISYERQRDFVVLFSETRSMYFSNAAQKLLSEHSLVHFCFCN
jgi:hypothetical protein